MVGAFFFFLGGYTNLVMGGILAQISSIIDGCDGEIARLKFQTSDFGRWYDAVLDRYADAFLLFGLTYYVYFPGEKFLYLLIGFFALIGSFMNSYTADKYDGLMKKRTIPGKHYFRIGRDVRIGIIFIGALINQPSLILFIIAFLTNTENVRRILLFYKSK
jgi:CDP-L-myo-inositol myo-inositolphosphotransferase